VRTASGPRRPAPFREGPGAAPRRAKRCTASASLMPADAWPSFRWPGSWCPPAPFQQVLAPIAALRAARRGLPDVPPRPRAAKVTGAQCGRGRRVQDEPA
jgi:hypothetical protein